MIVIAENINVMSKKLGKAMKAREIKPIQEVAEQLVEAGADYLDLNIGPAKIINGVLMGRHTDVAVGFGPDSDQPVSSSEEIPGRSHVLGIRIGFREIAGSQKVGDGLCVKGIMLLFVAADGFHVVGVAQVERDVRFTAAVRQPVVSIG